MSTLEKITYRVILILLPLLIVLSALAIIITYSTSQRLAQVEADVQSIEQSVTALNQATAAAYGHPVTATAYSPRKCETNGNPWETATQTRPKDGRTIAVSRDLLAKHDLKGKKVYIPGLGERVVEDVMNKRHKNSIDVFFEDTAEAKEFGKRPLIIIPLE